MKDEYWDAKYEEAMKRGYDAADKLIESIPLELSTPKRITFRSEMAQLFIAEYGRAATASIKLKYENLTK